MKKSTRVMISAILFGILLVGILLVAIGAGTIAKDNKYIKTAEWRDAIVHSHLNTDLTRDYVLYYNVDGITYEPLLDNSNDEYAISDTVRVYFDIETPEDYFIKTAEVFFVLLYIGIALIAVSTIALLTIYVPIYLHDYARKNGKTELVKINEIVDVIGGQKIICDGTKIKGRKGTPFKSARVGKNLPTYILNSAVTVYYIPKHKNIYYVDTNTIKFKENEE